MRIGVGPLALAIVRVVVGGLLIGGALALVSNGVALADASAVITDAGYQPQVVTVHVGETITWFNTGSLSHTVTSDDGTFDSGPIAPGARWSITATEIGTFLFHSSDGFRGELIVLAIDVTQAPLLTAHPSLLPVGSAGFGGSSGGAGGVSPGAIAFVTGVVLVLGALAFYASRRRPSAFRRAPTSSQPSPRRRRNG